MSYNMENFRRIREEYKEKYKKAEAEADVRRRELWEKIEGLRELDRVLSATGPRLLNAILGKSRESFAYGKTSFTSVHKLIACGNNAAEHFGVSKFFCSFKKFSRKLLVSGEIYYTLVGAGNLSSLFAQRGCVVVVLYR